MLLCAYILQLHKNNKFGKDSWIFKFYFDDFVK